MLKDRMMVSNASAFSYWLAEVGKTDDIKSINYNCFLEILFQVEKRLGEWTGAWNVKKVIILF
jgi:hypothetical protein